MKREEILKFYQKNKLYIFPLIVSLSALILIVFVIYPQTARLINNQRTQGENLKRLTLLESKVSALESYDEVDLNSKVDSALASYPVDKDFIQAIGLLQNLTAQAGFNITSLALGSGYAVGNAQSYNIKLDTSGPLANTLTLLNSIGGSQRLMNISNVEISIARDAQSSIVSLSIEILYAPAPQEFGSIDSPLPELSQKDQEILAKLARVETTTGQPQTSSQLPPRGRENPFE